MLFNSGTNSLVSWTRMLAGDPATAVDGTAVPSQLFATADVKQAVNMAYLVRRDEMRMKGTGHGNKRTLTDVVADQMFYAKPTDFIRLIHCEIETDGLNLSTAAEADTTIVFARSQEGTEAFRAYHAGELDSVTYCFMHDGFIAIVAPPDTAGTKSLRITYQGDSSELSADTDEPTIPTAHHSLICYDSAITLRISKQLPVQDLRIEQLQFARRFNVSLADENEDVEHQIPSPSRQRVLLSGKMGAVRTIRG